MKGGGGVAGKTLPLKTGLLGMNQQIEVAVITPWKMSETYKIKYKYK